MPLPSFFFGIVSVCKISSFESLIIVVLQVLQVRRYLSFLGVMVKMFLHFGQNSIPILFCGI